MKILNLYAGLGGNRKLWGDEHEVVAVEWNKDIAKIYSYFFPADKIIIADAHVFLLEHFQEFNFIWSSPPCPTHSRARKMLAWKTKKDGTRWLQNKPVYPSMDLYEEVILLDGYYKGAWVVENVIGYYEPLIEPQKIGRHYFWASKEIPIFKCEASGHFSRVKELEKRKGFDLSMFSNIDKKLILRNCVEPELGLHVFRSVTYEP